MPLSGQAKTDYQRRYMRERREQQRAARELPMTREPVAIFAPAQAAPAKRPPELDILSGSAGADAIARWSAEHLVVPTGRLSTRPFRLADWQVAWLRAAMGPGVQEAGLSVARKNGKSGLIAAVLLGHLVGPLHRPGWRAIVVSLTGALARELRTQIAQIAQASGIVAIDVLATPPPGRILGPGDAEVSILAADKATGHALGADIAVIDEAGLLQERDRPLWDAVYSCLSGRDGRLWCISIRGDGPMFGELAQRAGSPRVAWTEYAAREDAAIDDAEAWAAANPGLQDGIKSPEYMAAAAERAAAVPTSQAHFRAHDLNQPQDPSREMILPLSLWRRCEREGGAAAEGPCFVGIDLGGAASMSAAAAYWPATGLLRARGWWPFAPPLDQRGRADGVGRRYLQMQERGELALEGETVVDVAALFGAVEGWLAGAGVVCGGADRYRRQEAIDGMRRAGIGWPMAWRGQGASATADGSADVRAFQAEVMSGEVVLEARSLLLDSAIAGSAISRDAAGNPKLDRAASRARIDALSAAVIAVGLGHRWRAKGGGGARRYHGAVAAEGVAT